MHGIRTVFTRISTGIPAGKPNNCMVRRPSLKTLWTLGKTGRQVCHYGRQNSLYGLHCDQDTARLISVFAKGAVRS